MPDLLDLIDNATKLLEQEIAPIKNRLQFHEAAKVSLEKWKESAGALSPDLVELLLKHAMKQDETERTSANSGATVFNRLLKFYTGNDNALATNKTLRESLGVSRGSIAQVVYTTHADKFVKQRLAGKWAWKLKEARDAAANGR